MLKFKVYRYAEIRCSTHMMFLINQKKTSMLLADRLAQLLAFSPPSQLLELNNWCNSYQFIFFRQAALA